MGGTHDRATGAMDQLGVMGTGAVRSFRALRCPAFGLRAVIKRSQLLLGLLQR